jgi:glycosyltransferase involved in cell wall biosynthesis
MSVHNGMPFVQQAVDSILQQGFDRFEFVIVDDASSDETLGFLRSLRDPRVQVVSLEENLGLTAALNRGLGVAQGEFIARQDADDYSHPRRLENQIAWLQSHASCALVGAQARLIDQDGRSLGKKSFPLGHDGIRFAHLFDNSFAHSAVTFRSAVVKDLGGYDEEWRASQDYELWSRLSDRFSVANLPERLVTLRVRECSITKTHARADLIRRVQAAHYERLFGEPANEADLDLIGLVRSRVVPERLREFHGLLTELVGCYERRKPGATKASDFRRMLALLHERIGYNLLTLARRTAFAEFGRALKAWPPALFNLPWIRIAALTCMGEGARRLYGKLAR